MNKPLKLGEDASQLEKERGLDFKHFDIHDVVAVKRSDGRETVGRVLHIDHHSQFLVCGLDANVEKKVPFANVPEMISKIVGYCLTDSFEKEIFAAKQPETVSKMSTDIPRIAQTSQLVESILGNDDNILDKLKQHLKFPGKHYAIALRELLATEEVQDGFGSALERIGSSLDEQFRRFVIELFLRVCLPYDEVDVARKSFDLCVKISEPREFANSFLVSLRKIAGRQCSLQESNNVKACEGMQNEMLSHPFTVWHAAGHLQSGGQLGKASWEMVRFVVGVLCAEKIKCPWMKGVDLGVFGETPLHIVLLSNEPNQDSEEMFLFLWERCEDIRDYQYTAERYKGENVLHIAIVRNYKVDFLDRVHKIDKSRWESKLLKQHATGSFFKDPQHGCMLGELPLFFAACCCEKEVFSFLVETNANLKAVTETDENNLLHTLILREKVVSASALELSQYRKSGSTFSSTEPVATSDSDSHGVASKSFREILDTVITTLQNTEDNSDKEPKPQSMYETLARQKNKLGLTPLMLAAAEGSVWIFEYFFEVEKLKVTWVFGPVECVRMHLSAVDPALGDGSLVADRDSKVDSDREESILELLVRHERREILANCSVNQLINRKWDEYGDIMFQRRLLVSLFFLATVVALPIVNPVFARTMIYLMAMFCIDNMTQTERFEKSQLVRYLCVRVEPDLSIAKFLEETMKDFGQWLCFSSYRCYPLPKSGQTKPVQGDRPVLFKVRDFLKQTFSLFSPIILKILFCLDIFSFFGFLGLETKEEQSNQHIQWTQVLTTSLHVILGLLSVSNVIYSIRVFDGYGSIIYMLVKVLHVDIPMFALVYVLFLGCFTFYHYLASNNLHSGLIDQGADSGWRIFMAMIGKFVDEDENICQFSFTRFVVTGISVVNYFFVTVVLVNLFIAFLNNTIEDVSKEAKLEGELHRARILIEVEMQMPKVWRDEKATSFLSEIGDITTVSER